MVKDDKRLVLLGFLDPQAMKETFPM